MNMIPISAQKQKWASQLKTAAGKLDTAQKQQIVKDLDIARKTFDRYTSGEADEIRNIELAEKLLEAMRKIKQTANA